MGKGLSALKGSVQALIMLIVSIIIIIIFLAAQSENSSGAPGLSKLFLSSDHGGFWMEKQVGRGSKRVLPRDSLSNCVTGHCYLQGRLPDLVLPLGSWLLLNKTRVLLLGSLYFSRRLPTVGKAWEMRLE